MFSYLTVGNTEHLKGKAILPMNDPRWMNQISEGKEVVGETLAWLQSLQGGAATVVGTTVGSFRGLLAIILGAFVNAELNRRRDDRLRYCELSNVICIAKIEFQSVATALESLLENSPNTREDQILCIPLMQFDILNKHIEKLGMLPMEKSKIIYDVCLELETLNRYFLLTNSKVTNDGFAPTIHVKQPDVARMLSGIKDFRDRVTKAASDL